MLHKRSRNAVRGRRHGDRPRRCLLCRRLPLALFVSVWAFTGSESKSCFAVDPAEASQTPFKPLGLTDAEALRSVQWLASFALDKMPRTIDGDKHWGDTKRVWSGVKVRFDGGKLKTHRRYRDRKHGRWVRYEIQLPEIDASNRVTAKIRDVQFQQQSQIGKPRWQVKSTVVVPMKFEARVQRWNLGVKLFSVTIEGRMRVRMKSTALIGLETDLTRDPTGSCLRSLHSNSKHRSGVIRSRSSQSCRRRPRGKLGRGGSRSNRRDLSQSPKRTIGQQVKSGYRQRTRRPDALDRGLVSLDIGIAAATG